MSQLGELQKQMATALRWGEEIESAQAKVVTHGALTGAERMGIYHDSIRAGLVNALISTYPASQALVGVEFFSAMCYRYIATAPSLSPDLNDYGADLDRFIAGFAPAQSLPYFPDLARLEWAWHRQCFAPRNAPADLSGLSSQSEDALEKVRLRLPKGATFITSDYPLLDIWQLCVGEGARAALIEINSATRSDNAMHAAEPAESSAYTAPEIDLSSGGVCLLLYRTLDGRQMAALKPAEAFLLQKMQEGLAFGPLSEAYLAVGYTNEADEFTQVFARCAQQGWIYCA